MKAGAGGVAARPASERSTFASAIERSYTTQANERLDVIDGRAYYHRPMRATARPRARAFAGRCARRLGIEPGELAARRFFSPASSWLPENLVPSAWFGHAPFAFWLCGAARPASFVELGTHHGFSYLVVCQAIRDHHLNATACAIDTWQGDEHAGYYDTGVLADVRRRNGGFS